MANNSSQLCRIILWTEALASKQPEVVEEAFEDILTKAGAKPMSCASDLGPEFQRPLGKL